MRIYYLLLWLFAHHLISAALAVKLADYYYPIIDEGR